jgi:nitroreductase
MREALRAGLHRNHHDPANLFDFRRNIHRLEKGLILTMKNPQRPYAFGEDYIERTVWFLSNAVQSNAWEPETLSWGVAVLYAYFETVPPTPTIQAAHQTFQSLKLDNTRPALIPYRADERTPFEIPHSELHALALHRRSIRFFLDTPPPIALIQQALETGMQAPSACNRQSFRLLYFDAPQTVQRIVSIPGGVQGYTVPAVMVIIGRYRGYFDPRDIKCPIIDASLMSMGFLFALETLGLSSVCINWPETKSRNTAIREVIKLEDDEFVVMLIGIGYADPNGGIAYSCKRSLETVLEINPTVKPPQQNP